MPSRRRRHSGHWRGRVEVGLARVMKHVLTRIASHNVLWARAGRHNAAQRLLEENSSGCLTQTQPTSGKPSRKAGSHGRTPLTQTTQNGSQ